MNELVGLVRGCVVRCEVAMGLECGCRGCNGEGVRGHIEPVVVVVRGLTSGIVLARDMVVEPSPICFTWGHIGSARTVVGMVGVMWSASFPSTACTVTLVLKASDGWSDVGV